MTTTNFNDLLDSARALVTHRAAEAAARREANEQAAAGRLGLAWEFINATLPPAVARRATIDEILVGDATFRVKLGLDDLALAPIWFDVVCDRDGARLVTTRLTSRRQEADGYRVPTGYDVVYSYDTEVNGARWIASGDVYGERITQDLVEAVSYALEGWDSYWDALIECDRRNTDPGWTEAEAEAKAPLPYLNAADQLVGALTAFVAEQMKAGRDE